MKLLRDKLVETELALSRAVSLQENWQIRLRRKERRRIVYADTGPICYSSAQKDGRPKGDCPTGKTSCRFRKVSTGSNNSSTRENIADEKEEEEDFIVHVVQPHMGSFQESSSNIEVPNFRIVNVNPLSKTKRKVRIWESLEDDVFDKRHSKQENEEKRIVRWDRKRHREEQMRKKLQETSRVSIAEKYGKKGTEETIDNWNPGKIRRIEIIKKLPPYITRPWLFNSKKSIKNRRNA